MTRLLTEKDAFELLQVIPSVSGVIHFEDSGSLGRGDLVTLVKVPVLVLVCT